MVLLNGDWGGGGVGALAEVWGGGGVGVMYPPNPIKMFAPVRRCALFYVTTLTQLACVLMRNGMLI